jgi:large subunit ribosomal protein L3
VNGLIGKKIGMTSIFDDAGRNVACTVIQAGPNVVTQVKTEDSDGYRALQLGFGEKKSKNTTQALIGHFDKAKTAPKRKLVEFRNSTLNKAIGEVVSVNDVFAVGDTVAAIGLSKGKGFQGVVTRHGFSGVGDATHGQHNRLRAPGSIGASSFPSRVVKGLRMAGQDGNRRVKVKNLKVLKIFPEQHIMLVRGAVPGHKGALVIIEK